jgi:predicted ATPase
MINKIKIEKFKTISEFEFNLSNLNLFTGLNGMGKSTLLQSLLLVRQSFLSNSSNYQGEILLNGELIRLGYGKDIYAQYATGKKKVVFEIHDEKQNGIWELDWKSQDIDPDKSDIIKGKLSVTDEFLKSTLFNDNFVYISADRIGPQLSYPIGSIEKVRKRRLGNRGDYSLQFLSLVSGDDLKIPELKHSNAKTINILDNVNAWLGEISPGVKITVIPNTDIEAIRLTIQFDSGPDNVITNEFRPINVGFGLTYVLSIIISILSSQSGDIIILENPEAHLHPKGQSMMGVLASIAAENGVQLFIETHSDHILNGIRLSVKSNQFESKKIEIFYFDRPKGDPNHKSNIKNIKILDNAKLSEFPVGFFDEWNNALFKLVNVKNESDTK